jgi:serine protease Do
VQVGLPALSAGPPGGTSILRAPAKVVGAQIVALDEETDLAVLKVAERGLRVLPLADSDALKPGQVVLAFGSPLGLENSVTMGVVSAVARQVEPEDPMIYIQTDASINPGNSGGPLVDVEGRLVGINTFILSQSGGSEGLGFAAPSNIVRNVFDQIRKTGRVRRGEIPVYAQTITPAIAAGLGLPQEWGVVIGDVYPDSVAEKAGLEIGDVVLALDGKRMENGRQFQINLYGRAIGEPVTLDIARGQRRFTVKVPVTERPDDPVRFSLLANAEQHTIRRLGVIALDITEEVRDLLPDLRDPTGVVVAATLPDAPLSREGGLAAGDVIHAVNRMSIASVAELRAVLDKLGPDDAAVVQVERDGTLMFLGFRVER